MTVEQDLQAAVAALNTTNQTVQTNLNTLTSATTSAAANAAQTAADRTAVAADKATVAADKATVAADKATVVADKATVATDRAAVSGLLNTFRSVMLGAFANDSDAVTFANANGITIADGVMYQNTVSDKFRIYNGTAWQDYDSSAAASTSAAAVSAASAAASAAEAASTLSSALQSVTSMTALRALSVAVGRKVNLTGYYIEGDEGGGLFYGAQQATFLATTTGSGLNRTLKISSVLTGVIYPGMQIYQNGSLYGTILGLNTWAAPDGFVNYYLLLTSSGAANITQPAAPAQNVIVGKFVDDGGMFIVPTGGDGSLAWARLWDGEKVNVMWFGARGDADSDFDDAPAANAAFSKFYVGGEVVFPQAKYLFKSEVTYLGGYGSFKVSAYGAQFYTQNAIYAFGFRNANRDNKIVFEGGTIDHRGNTTALGGMMFWNCGGAPVLRDHTIFFGSSVSAEYAGVTFAEGTYFPEIYNCRIGNGSSDNGIGPTGILFLSYCNGPKATQTHLQGLRDGVVITTPTVKLENATLVPKTATITDGSISGFTLTVNTVTGDPLRVGAVLSGNSITANTEITALGTGTGGAGTYTVSISQTRPTLTATTADYGLLTTTSNDFTSSPYYNSIISTTYNWCVSSTSYVGGYFPTVTDAQLGVTTYGATTSPAAIKSGPVGSGPYEYVVNKKPTISIGPQTLYAVMNYVTNSVTVELGSFEGSPNGNGVRVYKDVPGDLYTVGYLAVLKNRIENVNSVVCLDGSAYFANGAWTIDANKHVLLQQIFKNLTPTGGQQLAFINGDASLARTIRGAVGGSIDLDASPAGVMVENSLLATASTFTGYISNGADFSKSGNILTAMTGTPVVGQSLTGTGVTAGTYITAAIKNTNYQFNGVSSLPAVGSTFQNNGQNFTVLTAAYKFNGVSALPVVGTTFQNNGITYTVLTASGAGAAATVTASGSSDPVITASSVTNNSGTPAVNFSYSSAERFISAYGLWAPVLTASSVTGNAVNFTYTSAAALTTTTTNYSVNIPQLTGSRASPTTFTQTPQPAIRARFQLGQGIYFGPQSYGLTGTWTTNIGADHGKLVAYSAANGNAQFLLSGINYKLSLGNVGGISASTTPANNLRGSVTFTNETAKDVAFPTSYFSTLTNSAISGTDLITTQNLNMSARNLLVTGAGVSADTRITSSAYPAETSAAITASIAGNVLTVTDTGGNSAAVVLGAGVYTTGGALLGHVLALGTGTGGTGTYILSVYRTDASGSLLVKYRKYTVNNSQTVTPRDLYGGQYSEVDGNYQIELEFNDNTPLYTLASATIAAKQSSFTASISTTTMTVTAMGSGADPIVPGMPLFGPSVAAGQYVVSQVTPLNAGEATGGIGRYNLGISNTLTSRTIYATYGVLSSTTSVVDLNGQIIKGTGVLQGTRAISGPSGAGPYTYNVNIAQTIASPITATAGFQNAILRVTNKNVYGFTIESSLPITGSVSWLLVKH